MTRKDLQNKFKFYGNNSDIYLYTKEQTKRGLGYLGSISLVNGKARFNGKSYGDVESLYAALKEWGDSLEWPVDTYNPMLNERYRLTDRIDWYLEEKLGFTNDRSTWDRGSRYVRNIGPGYALEFTVYEYNDKVTLTSKYAGLTFSQEIQDENEAVSMVANIARSEILMMAKDMIDTLSILPEKEITDVELFVESKRNLFGFEKVDFKTVMVDLLEKQLKAIKGE